MKPVGGECEGLSCRMAITCFHSQSTCAMRQKISGWQWRKCNYIGVNLVNKNVSSCHDGCQMQTENLKNCSREQFSPNIVHGARGHLAVNWLGCNPDVSDPQINVVFSAAALIDERTIVVRARTTGSHKCYIQNATHSSMFSRGPRKMREIALCFCIFSETSNH
jgi:hypothetical protein